MGRILSSDLMLLVMAALMTTAVYVPIESAFATRREAVVQSAVNELRMTPLAANVEQRVSSVAPTGVQAVEERARLVNRAIRECSEVVDSENCSDHEALFAEQQRRLRSPMLARAFGPEQFVSYLLAIWAVMIIARGALAIRNEDRLIPLDLIRLEPGRVITPSNAVSIAHDQLDDSCSHIADLQRSALQRFESSGQVDVVEKNVRDAADDVALEDERRRAMARFSMWAIPSVGFIGTVRGIGQALANADSPENLTQIVGYLGVAFDTTLIALLLSIVLQLLTHWHEGNVDSLVLNLVRACNDGVIRLLRPT